MTPLLASCKTLFLSSNRQASIVRPLASPISRPLSSLLRISATTRRRNLVHGSLLRRCQREQRHPRSPPAQPHQSFLRAQRNGASPDSPSPQRAPGSCHASTHASTIPDSPPAPPPRQWSSPAPPSTPAQSMPVRRAPRAASTPRGQHPA